jgi:hypothetical protein
VLFRKSVKTRQISSVRIGDRFRRPDLGPTTRIMRIYHRLTNTGKRDIDDNISA